MSEEIKIITLGDIFKNIETEEKAFKFKDYIKDLQQKVEQLEKEKNSLMYSLTLVRQKWNNDKARYRRKAKNYREQRNQLENIRKEAIDFILNGRYGEDDDFESISIYVPDLLNILNKGDNKE